MAQINIYGQYEEFLRKQVAVGRFATMEAAAEAAIRLQMQVEEATNSAIGKAIAKGEASIHNGPTVKYTPNLMNEISQKGKEAALAGILVKEDVKP